MTFEGIKPEFRSEDYIALSIYNALCDGMGGINWAGLELWVEKLGVTDVDGLLDRLVVIRMHEPPKPLDQT